MFVANVLISAATAPAKVRAFRIYTMRRAFFEINKFGLGELLFFVHDFSRNGLVLDRKWNEDRLPFFPRDTLPTKSDVFDFKIDDAQRSMLALQIAYAT